MAALEKITLTRGHLTVKWSRQRNCFLLHHTFQFFWLLKTAWFWNNHTGLSRGILLYRKYVWLYLTTSLDHTLELMKTCTTLFILEKVKTSVTVVLRYCKAISCIYHFQVGRKGTITAIYAGGTVDVKWDDGFVSFGKRSVELSLI